MYNFPLDWQTSWTQQFQKAPQTSIIHAKKIQSNLGSRSSRQDITVPSLDLKKLLTLQSWYCSAKFWGAIRRL